MIEPRWKVEVDKGTGAGWSTEADVPSEALARYCFDGAMERVWKTRELRAARLSSPSSLMVFTVERSRCSGALSGESPGHRGQRWLERGAIFGALASAPLSLFSAAVPSCEAATLLRLGLACAVVVSGAGWFWLDWRRR